MTKGKKSGGSDFEKGVSGNRAGRPRLDYMTQEAKSLTRATVLTAMHKVMEMEHQDIDRLSDVKKSPETIGAVALMASVLSKAIKKGNPMAAQFFMSYLFGRPVIYDPKDDNEAPSSVKAAESISSEVLTEVLRKHAEKLEAEAR